jgi:CubicO group peptidase (beta-lactamase class C family)
VTTLTSRLEETIGEQMQRSRVAGLAIALIKDGQLFAAEGYGLANVETGEKVTPDTRFSIMSVTKTIVATAIMQLVERGLLDLDAPANQYLAPSSKITNQWESETPVTTRGLLTHTGGLPIGGPMANRIPLAEFVANNARTTYRPGTDLLYANIGFDAAGVIIENLSGKRVDDYFREEIFAPLGMSASALANPADGEPRAYGHYRSALDQVLRILPIPEWATEVASPAGGVWSNVLDVSKFLVFHLGSQRPSQFVGQGPSPDSTPLLSSNSLTEMHRLKAEQGSSGSGQGLGFRVTRINGRRAICHGGDGGGFTAYVAAHPDEGAGVVLLQNTSGMQAARAVIGNTALASLVPPERKTFAASPPRDGTYQSNFWEITLEARNETLTPTFGLVFSEDPTPTTLQPTGDTTFEGDGGFLHGFEVCVEGERVHGGVYPFTFTRTGDLLPPSPPIDETADLIGTWTGHAITPIGPIPITLAVAAESAIAVTTPLTPNLAVERPRAARGRIEGEFTMPAPMGEIRILLRLEVRGGKLIGLSYGRHSFGETPFKTELSKQ